jgi:hypothetical protein
LVLATSTDLCAPFPEYTAKNAISFDTSDPGLTRRNFVIRPDVVRNDLPGQALLLGQKLTPIQMQGRLLEAMRPAKAPY